MQRILGKADLVGEAARMGKVRLTVAGDSQLAIDALPGDSDGTEQLIATLGAGNTAAKEDQRTVVETVSLAEGGGLRKTSLRGQFGFYGQAVVHDFERNVVKPVDGERGALGVADAGDRPLGVRTDAAPHQAVGGTVAPGGATNVAAVWTGGGDGVVADVAGGTEELGEAEEEIVVRGEDDGRAAAVRSGEGGEGESLVDVVGVDDVRAEGAGGAGDLGHGQRIDNAEVETKGGRNGGPEAGDSEAVPALRAGRDAVVDSGE